jgi:hypothetical protein
MFAGLALQASSAQPEIASCTHIQTLNPVHGCFPFATEPCTLPTQASPKYLSFKTANSNTSRYCTPTVVEGTTMQATSSLQHGVQASPRMLINRTFVSLGTSASAC